MGTSQHRATGQQQKYSLPGFAFDDAQFAASRSPHNAKTNEAMATVSQIAPARTHEEAREITGPAATVFAGMSAKLTTWNFAQDSWREDDVL